jgi:hypothetical protein
MLQTWFRWRGSRPVRKNSRSIVIAPQRKRQLQDTEVYSKLFYESKLKAIIDAEITGMSHNVAKIVGLTKREWANESDDVKAQVQAMKEDLRARSANPPDASSPEQRQAAIDNLGHLATAFLDHVHQTTNWTGYMVLGGLKPDMGGEIAIGSY